MKLLRMVLLLAGASLAFAVDARAMTGEQAEFRQIADGVYAFIGKRNDANAMAIVTDQGVVLVDTGNNPPETRILQKYIQSVTTQPVRFIIVTQNHGDHTGGTPLFSPPANVIVHDRVAKDWASWKPYQVKSWRKKFPERAEALKDFNPLDTVLSFSDRMTLTLGGKVIELIYIDDPYNPGDVAVWLPQSGVMHAGFVGYRERHPDIRPDYSHGTTWGMLKQLEVLSALKPKVLVPAHGPLGDVTHLNALTDLSAAGAREGAHHDGEGSRARRDREAVRYERIPRAGIAASISQRWLTPSIANSRAKGRSSSRSPRRWRR